MSFGAGLWEAVSQVGGAEPAKKSYVVELPIGLLNESLNQNTNVCAIRV